MPEYEIFDIKFPYLTNGNLYWARILAERHTDNVLFHVFPVNIIDFYRFDLIRKNDGSWQTESDYTKQKDFYSSVCLALENHLKKI